jgi:hypothetical protein
MLTRLLQDINRLQEAFLRALAIWPEVLLSAKTCAKHARKMALYRRLLLF